MSKASRKKNWVRLFYLPPFTPVILILSDYGALYIDDEYKYALSALSTFMWATHLFFQVHLLHIKTFMWAKPTFETQEVCVGRRQTSVRTECAISSWRSRPRIEEACYGCMWASRIGSTDWAVQTNISLIGPDPSKIEPGKSSKKKD